ncbi:MAG: hypothetical protein Q4A64_07905 [Porphyromonadaceae bacterium]|nr:hypothetical protein [Porphyromonadaceae bacterium]
MKRNVILGLIPSLIIAIVLAVATGSYDWLIFPVLVFPAILWADRRIKTACDTTEARLKKRITSRSENP